MLNLHRTREHVDELMADYKLAKNFCLNESTELKKAEQHLLHVEAAQTIAQEVAQEIQQQAHKQIATVVRECLKIVFFDKDYSFRINFVRKRGRTEAELILIKEGHEITDPLEADSGGVLDIASFALRLSCLVMSKPKLRKLLVLDEPFKNLSAKYREHARSMLEKLAKDFKVQFLMVTHQDEYHIGKVVEI